MKLTTIDFVNYDEGEKIENLYWIDYHENIVDYNGQCLSYLVIDENVSMKTFSGWEKNRTTIN